MTMSEAREVNGNCALRIIVDESFTIIVGDFLEILAERCLESIAEPPFYERLI